MNRMDEFLKFLVKVGQENPGIKLDEKTIYSLLIRHDLTDFSYEEADLLDNKCETLVGNVYNYVSKINPSIMEDDNFLWIMKGCLCGNEIKLYIPLPIDNYEQGAKELFEFMAKEKMYHQSKISKVYRNDNVVVRVNNIRDAKMIMDFVQQTPSLARVQQPNPFVPNVNGIGMTMDNNYSYNFEVCKMISQAYERYGKYLNLDYFHDFISETLESDKIEDLDLRDIYTILELQTNEEKSVTDVVEFLRYKSADKYTTNDRTRITDPRYYLEAAIIETYNEVGEITGLREFLKSNDPIKANNITANNEVRNGVFKYVSPTDKLPIMIATLEENGIDASSMDENVIIEYYLSSVLGLPLIEKEEELAKTDEIPEITCYNIIKKAMNETMLVHPTNNKCLDFLKQLLSGGAINTAYITRTNDARDSIEEMFEKYTDMNYSGIAATLLNEVYGIDGEAKTR